jgi:hypothetical protein
VFGPYFFPPNNERSGFENKVGHACGIRLLLRQAEIFAQKQRNILMMFYIQYNKTNSACSLGAMP